MESDMTKFETDRLKIRNFQASDGQALHTIILQYQDSGLALYDQPWPTSPEEIQKITEWFASEDHFLAVCLKTTGELIGLVGLNPEEGRVQRVFNLGYAFHFGFHGQGYATEACQAVLSRAFVQLQADQVATGTAAANQASCRLLERLGFRKCGEEMTSFKNGEDGRPLEFLGCRYAISREEWKLA
jgi:[ribosomal protein S5]-alanine N-acetyltransferase